MGILSRSFFSRLIPSGAINIWAISRSGIGVPSYRGRDLEIAPTEDAILTVRIIESGAISQ